MSTCSDCTHCGPAEGGLSFCHAHPPVVDGIRLKVRLEKGDKFRAASFQASLIPVVVPDQRKCGEFYPRDVKPPRRPFREILRQRHRQEV